MGKRTMLTVLSALCLVASVLLGLGGTPASAAPRAPAATRAALGAGNLPLHTSGRYIQDAQGDRVKLAAVNWYGADSPDYVVGGLDHQALGTIVSWIKNNGFNAVRIPWSNQMWEQNPVIAPARLSANPQLGTLTARQGLDAVVNALSQAGIMVILDNHTSTADWCCALTDGNGLWFNDSTGYPQSSWIDDWKSITQHYAGNPWVVGAELRNELRQDTTTGRTPVWGGGGPYDWHQAAETGGNAVLGVNPNLLVFVDGLKYATDLTGVANLPVTLNVAGRLVYAAHMYYWDYNAVEGFDKATGTWDKADYNALWTQNGDDWGYILTQGKSYTAPIWVSEFGTCNESVAGDYTCNQAEEVFYAYARRYMGDADIDWAYWDLNGTKSSGGPDGTNRKQGTPEEYGLLNTSWSGTDNADHLQWLKRIQPVGPACSFSQTCWSYNIESTPGGSTLAPSYAGDGLYVMCWTTGPSVGGDTWWLNVNWTSRYQWQYTGYLPDDAVGTYNADPSYYWPHC